CTSWNSMAWGDDSWLVVEAESRGKVGADMRLVIRQHVHQELRDKQVDHDDQNRGGHYGLRGGPAYSLRASAGRHSIEATRGGDDEAEQERLDQPHEDILKHQRLPGVAPVLAGVEGQKNFGKNNMKTVETTRGATSFFMGSVPKARMASICSVTTMDPSSLAIPDAFRPATIKPVSTGPNSRTMESDTNWPISVIEPNRCNVFALCTASTAPVKKPVRTTMGRDPTPIRSACWTISAK